MNKDSLFLKCLIWMGVLFAGSLFFVGLPLLMACPSYGKSYVLSIPPMFLMALSWMASAWWTRGKDYLFFAVTMGGIPLRIALGLLWALFVFTIPDIHQQLFIFFMMLHWVLFTIVEVAMMCKLSNIPIKKLCTLNVEVEKNDEIPSH